VSITQYCERNYHQFLQDFLQGDANHLAKSDQAMQWSIAEKPRRKKMFIKYVKHSSHP
jgi:hypothetical protein